MAKRLVLIDGNALLHRAYHATPPLSTSKGELVNAVYGFSLMILKALDDLKPDFAAIAWDELGPTFRHQMFTQYKATRGPADDGLKAQYERVYQVARALNILEYKLAGYEADDLIGTLARQALKFEIRNSKFEIIILTGDRDIMQVIDKNIKVLMPKKTLSDAGLYGVSEFMDRYGFEPKQLVDYKALAGDVSDNIPGVSGIGEVSATKLIQKFGSLENIYNPQNLKTLPERMQKLLSDGAESAVLSKKLATLDFNAPIKLDLTKCRIGDIDYKNLLEIFKELEFKSLVTRISENSEKLSGSEKSADQTIRKSEIPDSLDNRVIPSHSEYTANLDKAVSRVLDKMSQTGILPDLKFLSKMGKVLKARLTTLEQEIYSKIGHKININSPKQLQIVLFDELGLPVVRKTKTGRSTDEATLHELSGTHPVIDSILEYRVLFKLISTYIDALPKYAGSDGRIHSTFNVEGAATGRLSSQDPNLQNIPVKGQLGSEIRKAFIAAPGKVLLGADYSQIELRILAHVSDDPGLKKAFSEGLDIHTLTASKIFKIAVSDVTKEQRMVGKTMNFATLYGQGPHALSKQLKVDYEVASIYIDEYFAQFPKVKLWMASVLEKAYQNGYVETLWGRRRYMPELTSASKEFRSFGERAAINHPIQGTSADMIKKAMLEIDRELVRSSKLGVRSKLPNTACQLILQIHDELLFECDPKLVEDMSKIVKEKMEHALKLSVPVVVDLKIGPNWGEMAPVKF